jgi:2-iminobutanoate/2-iminopropanoate deaminase
LDQLKLCVETAGSSLENILKLNVYVTSVDMFPAVNAVYRRYFPENPPARIFINVPAWNGGFDIEVDCIVGSGNSGRLIPEILARSVAAGKISSGLR